MQVATITINAVITAIAANANVATNVMTTSSIVATIATTAIIIVVIVFNDYQAVADCSWGSKVVPKMLASESSRHHHSFKDAYFELSFTHGGDGANVDLVTR